MRASWTILGLANSMSDGVLANIDPRWLAGLGFGTMRAEALEHMYHQHESESPYSDLEEKNEVLLKMKQSAESTDSWTFYSVRDAYYKNSKLRQLLRRVPKGNYAHLHFNAYLSTEGISDVYTEVRGGDPIFSGADTTDFQELLKTARQPHGDLMDFPGGGLEGRADM